MVRRIEPGHEVLDRLEPPLSHAERMVIDFFDKSLSVEWEIYVRPHLNGHRPSLVLLHPRCGIGIFQVESRSSHELATAPLADHAFYKVNYAKESTIRLYSPKIAVAAAEAPAVFGLVTAGVIAPNCTNEQADAVFSPARIALGHGERAHVYPISGSNGNLQQIFPRASHELSLMTKAIANDLRSWLVEPSYEQERRAPLEMDNEQRRLATSRPERGYRRLKGPAGSGKSVVLSARAAQLSAEGKDVLVVPFNITLPHYLRDLAQRYPEPRRALVNRVSWMHFHEWCKRVCFETGYHQEYGALFRDRDADSLSEILEREMVDLVNLALSLPRLNYTRYDAILVDEGQDFNNLWWNALRRVLSPGGEMLLVADETQDLYERAHLWTEAAMSGAGFTGAWSRLRVSYRLPPEIVPFVKQFAVQFLDLSRIDLPEPDPELALWPADLAWYQASAGLNVRDSAIASFLADVVLQAPTIDGRATGIAFSDVTFLVQRHDLGLACVEELRRRGVGVAHVFGVQHLDKKNRKLGFFQGEATVKGATMHSFKGWEARCLVVLVSQASHPTELAAIYVALSRLKRHTQGSRLIVVSMVPELAAFGASWPNHHELVATNGSSS